MAPPLRSRRTRRKQSNSTARHLFNKVEENGGGEIEEGSWRFQAELLRDECSFLRTEREFALKKLEKNNVKMERTLQSAVHTLISVSLYFYLQDGGLFKKTKLGSRLLV